METLIVEKLYLMLDFWRTMYPNAIECEKSIMQAITYIEKLESENKKLKEGASSSKAEQ